jgi:hypothetical protein
MPGRLVQSQCSQRTSQEQSRVLNTTLNNTAWLNPPPRLNTQGRGLDPSTYPGTTVENGTVFVGKFSNNTANYTNPGVPIGSKPATNRSNTTSSAANKVKKRTVNANTNSNQTNSGRLVFYRSIAETYGGRYHSAVGDSSIVYIDDVTYPEYGPAGQNPTSLDKRVNTNFQLNLYWDWWGNWYAASWEGNQNSNYYGWNSYLGCIDAVYQNGANYGPDTVADVWSGAITSFSYCALSGDLDPENYWGDQPWCAPVGYNPGALQRSSVPCSQTE